jgi:hypothetical protein
MSVFLADLFGYGLPELGYYLVMMPIVKAHVGCQN